MSEGPRPDLLDEHRQAQAHAFAGGAAPRQVGLQAGASPAAASVLSISPP